MAAPLKREMATSQKLTEHFLTCPVCFEVFTNPSTLACDHTFCGQCVVSYTKTRPDAISARSLLCPTCKRQTKVPDPQRPVEEWPSQMKPGLLLLGLMDTIGPGAKDTNNCNLCHEGGETTSATAWCSVCDVSLCDACLKVHGRMPATRHHVASDLSGEVMVKSRRKVMCCEHKDECIKFYCKDCKKTLCQSCCIVYHRKCESVLTLESMMPEMRTDLEVRKETLKKKLKNEEELLDSRKSQCSDVNKTKSIIQAKVRSTVQKAMDALKKKENKFMDELNEVTDKQMDQLKVDIKTGGMAIQIYRQQSEVTDQALNSDNEMDMYNMYKSRESEAFELEVETHRKERNKSRIEFSQDTNKLNKALQELQLGKIEVIREGMLDSESLPLLSRTIDCRTADDSVQPSLYDVICMNVNGVNSLVFTDWMNKCITAFSTSRKQSRQNRLELQNKPCRIAKIEDNKLAVTLSDSRQIITVAVSPKLLLLSSIRTSKQYRGLTALTSTTLAAGSQSPPCVDILDRSGNVLQSISPIYNGQPIIKYPESLRTTNKGNILVSDREAKSVLCLTPLGDIVFKYSPTGDRQLEDPRGITNTDTGDILFVDYKGHKVIQLNESGHFVRDILTAQDGVVGPYCLDYDERGSIYVECGAGSIQVFTFK